MTHRIVIVGGGYIGADLARGLEVHADVTLIEPRSHFLHAPAMIRALIDPALLNDALIPYGNLLTRGHIAQARATAVDGEGVTLDDGTRIAADTIVLATGSSNAAPFKPEGADLNALRQENTRVHALLQDAQTIAIVGAGAVGTELAGEIAHAMKGKQITLISSRTRLFPDFPAALGRGLAEKLRQFGVTLEFDTRIADLESLTAPYAGSLSWPGTEARAFDLIFPAVGSRPVTALLETLPGAEKGQEGRIKTDPWLRPSELPHVFAAGDAAETGDAMTIVGTSRQAPWLKSLLKARIAGRKVEHHRPYRPWSNPPILVPLGPRRGNSHLSLFTAGDFVTRMMKGRDLFIPKYRRLLRQDWGD